MQHFTSLQDVDIHGAWLTIGSFDGVHLGHRRILEKLTAGARQAGVPAVVLTFFPHPAVVLRGLRESFYLTSPQEKAELLGELGVDVVVTHPFNANVAQVSAEAFVAKLQAHLGFTHLWVGHDFAMGHDRQGDVPRLKELGAELGFTVHTVEAVEMQGEVVSSSRVRRLLDQGEVGQAARLLARPYRLEGKVVPGDGRGQLIGVPTANLSIWKERLVPASGVYVCRVFLQGQAREAVTNVGVRPTFVQAPEAPTVETHLLDFEGDLYGQELKLEFLARLRDEKRFSGVEELVTQIEADIAAARQLFERMAAETGD